MDLTYTPAQQAFRAEARAWLTANVPREPLQSFDTEQGFAQHRAWENRLNDGRWGMVTWPVELGGRGCDLIEWLIFEEEYYRAEAPARVNQNGIFLLGPTLMEYGSEAQKARFLPRMATGEDIWAQAWSEPGAGSDMAAIRSRAERVGDHYVINGQKTWSTRAVWADWVFGIFRTDPNSQRHHGLTFILLPLDTPGITVRPIPQLNGLPGFAEIFFDDVKVPVENALGGEGMGWHVAMSTAGFERGLLLRSPARFQETARRLVQLYQANREQADRDPAIGEAVMRAWLDAEAYTLNTYRTASQLVQGGKIGPESSTNKIFWSELDQRMHDTAMSILGLRGELLPEAPAAGDVGHWLEGFLFAQAGPIYAGTNEIQRNIIAERMLGMPRA
ncbi:MULTISPECIES: acyl-CoA dehydrogenase family protein [Pseudomonas]|jgi:alkylation response protein AidB-like acyl-CoA dehydrogenase|uniref:Acyl-CoA dehydrogenase n=1 Tax=Pseudomonas kribbensis TaxID=1628086 RepID=A0A345RQT2_9PSED|nr:MULTISPECIES: acyl-CoA dehydrogenase family protein [Pseudomonas]AXI61648.1 acyl-CoA dehydrogenase [Pseudomonas kribbensis]EJM31282.1 acyl-CoA dehydrogenase [Pseudomonas sp. GM25]MCU0091386.1 acyl-CoA dehydrogenase family protein [Pseudomonas koreensis]MDD1139394.1 acyl-CoA dehydrogenase family protein [Pseudomonas aphyarum]